MAKKKTVWKWIGAIAFALLAMISVVQNIKLLNVIAFAAICYVMTGKKELPAENA